MGASRLISGEQQASAEFCGSCVRGGGSEVRGLSAFTSQLWLRLNSCPGRGLLQVFYLIDHLSHRLPGTKQQPLCFSATCKCEPARGRQREKVPRKQTLSVTGESSVQVPAFVCVLRARPWTSFWLWDCWVVGAVLSSRREGFHIWNTREQLVVCSCSQPVADRRRPAVIRAPWHPAVRVEEVSPSACVWIFNLERQTDLGLKKKSKEYQNWSSHSRSPVVFVYPAVGLCSVSVLVFFLLVPLFVFLCSQLTVSSSLPPLEYLSSFLYPVPSQHCPGYKWKTPPSC